MTNATSQLVDAYYAAWGSGDLDRFDDILTDDFQVRVSLDQAD